ncbi:hypothetical protein C882_3158 [Caenispirillum salinarum AK4]|uniref:Uncharacterized protein n=1 Tax=Caenispirillum salinarum AK4 TaxID=1238182 RepID=K9H4U4_9PROT|nr:hypothetical protein [Caenispirillum salinarum]EKV32094.1 hypothetical protein C882_3158 [Caenispirillum salinarum AK4]
MAEEKWHENVMVRVGLGTGVGIVALLVLLNLFYDGDRLPEGATSTDYQSGDWVSPVPDSLRGTWAVEGRCEDDDSLMVIFSNGGYRWRKSRTDWGFARGKYRYTHPNAYRIEFQLQRFQQPSDNPDAVITVSGNEMRKYNLMGGTNETFIKCPS